MTAKVALMHSIARQKWWAWHKLFLFCYIPRNCSAAEKETHNQYHHSSRYHRRVIRPYTEVQTSEEVCSDWIDVLMKILRHVICQSWDSTQVVRKKVRVMMKISLDMHEDIILRRYLTDDSSHLKGCSFFGTEIRFSIVSSLIHYVYRRLLNVGDV